MPIEPLGAYRNPVLKVKYLSEIEKVPFKGMAGEK